jgi:hypothetical protein
VTARDVTDERPICADCCLPGELWACGLGQMVFRTVSRSAQCRRCDRKTKGRLAIRANRHLASPSLLEELAKIPHPLDPKK